MPIAYHQGSFVEASSAGLSLQDRGVLFADGVYEVVRYDHGRPFAMQPHVDRLKRSLVGIGIEGVDADALAPLSDELIRRNGYTDAKVYWQVTRGDAGPRDFVTPAQPNPTVTLLAYPTAPVNRGAAVRAGKAITVDDCRWTKCWIKSLMLLPASLAKSEAARRGALEAIFIRNKPGSGAVHVTEGGSTNLFIVRDGELHTHPNDGWVLPGVTRDVLIDAAAQLGRTVRELCFSPEEMFAADEVFVCSTTQLNPLTQIDDKPIADGRPGAVTTDLHHAYLERILHHDQ
jgi:D-alanine transaminase